jgi:hypothetical protein
VPIEQPADSSTFSVAEELSTSEVTELAWSPHGLAKYGRCALAILTSNLALSLWTPGVAPRSPQSWKRAFVINQELTKYFEKTRPIEHPETSGTLKEIQRIRAFSWSPTAVGLRDPQNKNLLVPPQNFIVVANDHGENIILWVPRDRGLSPQAVAHFSVAEAGQNSSGSKSTWTFEDYMSNQIATTQIAWGPWVPFELNDSTGLVAIIAYANRTHLRFRQVHVTISDGVPKITVGTEYLTHTFPRPGSICSSLYWSPKVEGVRVQLIVALGAIIWCHSISVFGDDELKSQSYTRSDWDPISGMRSHEKARSRPDFSSCL